MAWFQSPVADGQQLMKKIKMLECLWTEAYVTVTAELFSINLDCDILFRIPFLCSRYSVNQFRTVFHSNQDGYIHIQIDTTDIIWLVIKA